MRAVAPLILWSYHGSRLQTLICQRAPGAIWFSLGAIRAAARGRRAGPRGARASLTSHGRAPRVAPARELVKSLMAHTMGFSMGRLSPSDLGAIPPGEFASRPPARGCTTPRGRGAGGQPFGTGCRPCLPPESSRLRTKLRPWQARGRKKSFVRSRGRPRQRAPPGRPRAGRARAGRSRGARRDRPISQTQTALASRMAQTSGATLRAPTGRATRAARC
jgi:hypothetical protein